MWGLFNTCDLETCECTGDAVPERSAQSYERSGFAYEFQHPTITLLLLICKIIAKLSKPLTIDCQSLTPGYAE